MRWEDERYVRFYTRDTPEFLALSWHARGLIGLVMRKLDRAGVLVVGKLGLRGVAVAIGAPWVEVEGPLRELLDDGCLIFDETKASVVMMNFIEAQEAKQSDKARQSASRERARAGFAAGRPDIGGSTRTWERLENGGAGVVYFVEAVGTGRVKVGFTAGPIGERVASLQTACPVPLVVLATCPGTPDTEKVAHLALEAFRTDGEWFDVTDDLLSYMDTLHGSRRVTPAGHIISRRVTPGHAGSLCAVPSLADPAIPYSAEPPTRMREEQDPIPHTQRGAEIQPPDLPPVPDATWLAAELSRYPAVACFADDHDLCADLAGGLQAKSHTRERASEVISAFVTKEGKAARGMSAEEFQRRFGGYVANSRLRGSGSSPSSEPQTPDVREALGIFAERWKASKGSVRVEDADDAEHAATCIEQSRKAIDDAKSDVRPREVFRRAVDAYLGDAAPRLADAQWPLRMLARQFSSYAALPTPRARPGPAKAQEEPLMRTTRRAPMPNVAGTGNMGPVLALVMGGEKS